MTGEAIDAAVEMQAFGDDFVSLGTGVLSLTRCAE